MATTTLIEPAPEKTTTIITVTKRTIQENLDGFLGLTIAGIDDKKTRELVSTARKACVKLRTTADKERKAVKADALAECNRIDQHWKELFAMIEPVELHLTNQEKKIAEAEAIIERERVQKLVAERVSSMERIGWNETFPVDRNFLATASEDQFNQYRMDLAKQVAAKREDDKRRSEEAAKLAKERAEFELSQKLEREKLEADRDEAERVRKAEQTRLDAERQDLERKQAELRTQQEAADKLDRDRRQAEANARLEAERLAKVQAMRPDYEKLLSVIDQISAIEIPEVGAASEHARAQITAALQTAYETIGRVLEGMVR